jgi:hypothetical protein
VILQLIWGVQDLLRAKLTVKLPLEIIFPLELTQLGEGYASLQLLLGRPVGKLACLFHILRLYREPALYTF